MSFARTCAMFAIVVVGTGLGGMTQTALNTMASVVLADLGSEIGWGQWLTTLYIFAMGAAVPLAAYLQRRFSVRRLMLMSYGLYLVGSLCDYLAIDFSMLLVGRVLEALGTGILMPLLQTIAMTRFPENRHGTAMGIAGISLGFAPNMGPVLGGALCDAVGWRVMFLILSITSLVFTVLTLFVVSERSVREPEARLDWGSLVLSTFGFGGVLLGFTAAANMPLAHPLVWASILVGCLCIWFFARRQSRVGQPLINLRIFAFRDYRRAMVAQCLLYGCFVGMTLIIPLTIIDGSGHTALEAGFALFPGALVALVCEPGAGAASDRFGVRRVAIFGAFFLFVGAIGIAFVPLAAPVWMFAAFQTIRCIGVTTLIPCTTAWGLGPLGPVKLTPDGSAALIMMRQIAAALATACMVFILKTFEQCGYASLGFHAALGFSGVLGFVTLVFAIAFIRHAKDPMQSAEKED